MKLGKKASIALAFTLGAVVFTSTAFADMAIGSGYNNLKNALKTTTAKMESGLSNFTMRIVMNYKDNGAVIFESDSNTKVNNEIGASISEEISTYPLSQQRSSSNFKYQDKTTSISKTGGSEEVYYVMQLDPKEAKPRIEDPFKEKRIGDYEKLFDAIVGNLKEYVQAEESSDGSRVYSGSLSEVQVPALINAVSSFGVKQVFDNRGYPNNNGLPEIESDISVKSVTGRATEDKNGVLQQAETAIILQGKDKNGSWHDLELSMSFQLTNIGSTIVQKPDLTDKKVKKVSRYGRNIDSKYIGTYKNNIVIEKDGQFVKVGERILVIVNVDENIIQGRYYETLKEGYDDVLLDKYDFTFEMPQEDNMNSVFNYKTISGESKSGTLYMSSSGKIQLGLDVKISEDGKSIQYGRNERDRDFDSEFNRVFED